MRLAFGVFASVGIAACGLSVVGSGTDAASTDSPDVAAPPATVADTSAPPTGPDGGDGGTVVDATADGPVLGTSKDSGSPGCTTFTDDFSPYDGTRWTVMGGASNSPGKGIALTQNGSSGQRGALWMKQSMTLGSSLHVTVDFLDEVPGGAADGEGIAIAWASASGLGGSDKGLGICGSGLTGVAALLYSEDGNQHLQATTGISATCVTNGSAGTTVGGSGTFELTLTKGGTVTAKLGSKTEMEGAGTVPATGVIGVTASTASGNNRSNFTITSITIESCP